MKIINKKTIILVITNFVLVSYSFSSWGEDSGLNSFGYAGLDIGYGKLGDDVQFSLGSQDEEVKNSAVSYGGELIYLQSMGDDSYAWGVSLSHTRLTTENAYSGATVDATFGFTGVGVLVGKIVGSEGKRYASYIGYEYHFDSSLEFDCQGSTSDARAACDLVDGLGGLLVDGDGSAQGVAAGVIGEVSPGFAVGLGARMIFSDAVDNPLFVYVTAGFSF